MASIRRRRLVNSRMTKYRIGRFIVNNIIFDHPEAYTGLFSGMVVRYAREKLDGALEYVAWHPSFREIDPGEIIPLYDAMFKDGNVTPKWQERIGRTSTTCAGTCVACQQGLK